MKKILLTAAAVVALSSVACAEEQTVHGANVRLNELANMFKANGVATFDMLNGLGGGGSGAEISSKGKTSYQADLSVIQSGDPKGGLFCVKNSQWVVNVNHMLLGKNADNDVMFKLAVDTLRKNPGAPRAVVEYDEVENGVSDKRKLVVISSAGLLGNKNTTGQKFVCWTSAK